MALSFEHQTFIPSQRRQSAGEFNEIYDGVDAGDSIELNDSAVDRAFCK
jgi:hypothetical protein